MSPVTNNVYAWKVSGSQLTVSDGRYNGQPKLCQKHNSCPYDDCQHRTPHTKNHCCTGVDGCPACVEFIDTKKFKICVVCGKFTKIPPNGKACTLECRNELIRLNKCKSAKKRRKAEKIVKAITAT